MAQVHLLSHRCLNCTDVSGWVNAVGPFHNGPTHHTFFKVLLAGNIIMVACKFVAYFYQPVTVFLCFSSLGCAFSPTVGSLIAFRFLGELHRLVLYMSTDVRPAGLGGSTACKWAFIFLRSKTDLMKPLVGVASQTCLLNAKEATQWQYIRWVRSWRPLSGRLASDAGFICKIHAHFAL